MIATIQSLPVLVLYPHARCNCRCLMCDIWKRTDESELSIADLEGYLADIEALSVKWVIFSGGEPLMHSDLFRLSDMLRLRNIRVTLLSTGLLLARYANQIVAGIDDVIVSLDGPRAIHDKIRRVPGAFSELAAGVRALRHLNPWFFISARCTVQKANCTFLRETASEARALGLDSISFLAADLTSEAFNRAESWDARRQSQIALSEKEIIWLEDELLELHREWAGTGFVLENSDKLRRIVLHFQSHIGLAEATAPRCNAPWVSAVVEGDGTVRPCFFHRPIGSLKSHTLLQVLNGFEAQQFRAGLNVATNPVCRRCVCSLNWEPAPKSALVKEN
jgi:Fe-coproporphyrin III synthase